MRERRTLLVARTSTLCCSFAVLTKRGVRAHELPTQLKRTFVAGGVMWRLPEADLRDVHKQRLELPGVRLAGAGGRNLTLRTEGVKTLESSSACRMSSWEAVRCVDCSFPFLSRWLNVMPRCTCSMSLLMQSLQSQVACQVQFLLCLPVSFLCRYSDTLTSGSRSGAACRSACAGRTPGSLR